MNFYRGEESSSSCCYFHPKEAVVGICALCLKERLVILASKQGHHHLPLPNKVSHNNNTHKSFRILRRKPIMITFNKVFALGSFLHLLDFKQQKPHVIVDDEISADDESIPSLEDSFISIKFEENGRAMWDDKKMMKNNGKEVKSVVEHSKPRGTLRWRKRIGQLLQMARWKRSTKAGTCHVGLPGKVEGRRGWIRSLTRRRTTINTEC